MYDEFDLFVAKRCENALLKNEEYTELTSKGCEDELQSMAEILCYKQGWKDAVKMLIDSQDK